MEPLEIAASVIGIISFSTKVSLIVGKYIQEVHGIHKTLKLFDETLQSLRESLNQIVETAKDNTSDAERFHLKAILRISNDCYAILVDLEKDLPGLHQHPNIFKKIVASFETKLNETTTREKLNAIQRYCDQLSLSFTALSMLVYSSALWR